jgi:hypothetical protein
LIGAEPIDLAAVRQGDRFARQVAEMFEDFAFPSVREAKPTSILSQGEVSALFRIGNDTPSIGRSFAAAPAEPVRFGWKSKSDEQAPALMSLGAFERFNRTHLNLTRPRQGAAGLDDALIFSSIWALEPPPPNSTKIHVAPEEHRIRRSYFRPAGSQEGYAG